MYLLDIHIKGVRCFEDVKLDLRNDDGSPRLWTVLLGDNGCGKSTVLQSIALLLSGQTASGRLAALELCPQPKDANTPGELSCTLLPDPERPGPIARVGTPQPRNRALSCGLEYLVPPDAQPTSTGALIASPVVKWPPGNGHWTEAAFHGGTWPPSPSGHAVCGYGPQREGPATREFEPAKARTERWRRVATLFTPSERLPSPDAWLRDADYRSRSDEPGADGHRNLLHTALVQILPDVNDVTISPDGTLFSTKEGALPLDSLSDGYRGMIAWVVDLLAQLAGSHPGVTDLRECEAVVLIDEIDAHLHPKWQREVIPRIRACFPRLQFIVTTHSPLVLHGTESGEVIVLERPADDQPVEARPVPWGARGWRADQLLTSRMFGLETALDSDTEDLLLEEARLLGQPGDAGALRKVREKLDQRFRYSGALKGDRELRLYNAELHAFLEKHVGKGELEAARQRAREAIARDLNTSEDDVR